MNVQGIGNGVDHGRAVGLLRNVDDISESIENNENPVSEPVEQVEVDEQSADQEGAGVLRLLQEGHFKGVADVRLRINFHVQLVAMQNDAIKDVAAEKLPVFAESIGGQVEAMLSLDGMTEEQVTATDEAFDTFRADMARATEEFTGAENPSADNLESTVRSRFDTFMDSLQGILIPETTAEPEETDVEAEPIQPEDITLAEDSADAEPDFRPFLDTLTETFEKGLAELMDSLNSVNTLPELSQPSGNGKAYEKFLAIYNDVWGTQTSSDSQELSNADLIA
jgi:hypothetical protein